MDPKPGFASFRASGLYACAHASSKACPKS